MEIDELIKKQREQLKSNIELTKKAYASTKQKIKDKIKLSMGIDNETARKCNDYN